MAHIPPTHTYANVTIPNGGTAITGGLTYSTTTGVWATTATNKATVRITEEDIEIKGTSLAKVLETLEERLAILQPNPKLEAEFEQLAEIRRQYIALEKELKEKAKMWATLKTTDQ